MLKEVTLNKLIGREFWYSSLKIAQRPRRDIK